MTVGNNSEPNILENPSMNCEELRESAKGNTQLQAKGKNWILYLNISMDRFMHFVALLAEENAALYTQTEVTKELCTASNSESMGTEEGHKSEGK